LAGDLQLTDFIGRRVWVLGDLLLDRYVHARPERLSREAPLPVFVEIAEELRPGGAGNSALNLAALGAKVELIAPLGEDAESQAALERLKRAGVECGRSLRCAGYRTPLKTRVLAADQSRTPVQVLRLDREPTQALQAADREQLCARVALGPAPDLILCADYGYGALSPELLIAARNLGAPLLLDPRRSVGLGSGFLALTPNLPELAELCHLPLGELAGPAALEQAARSLAKRLSVEHLLVTLGNRGMALFSRGRPALGVPASGAERVVDVSGAGDTAAAGFGLALAAGWPAARAMELANAAAGLVVLELGAVAVQRAALESIWPQAPQARPLAELWANSSRAAAQASDRGEQSASGRLEQGISAASGSSSAAREVESAGPGLQTGDAATQARLFPNSIQPAPSALPPARKPQPAPGSRPERQQP
jgi:D-beta-D-heptose 7-phosphate kinase/D-beta-D-heptose 1-phosphate adenosyltransferase